MNAKKYKTSFKIEAEWATDFQNEIGGTSLERMIHTWANWYKSRHNKNKIWINGKEIK